MTRTDRNGIVTRSCATIPKTVETCEEDDRGALLCYCLTSYCNGGADPGLVARGPGAVALLASAVVVALSRWKDTRWWGGL